MATGSEVFVVDCVDLGKCNQNLCRATGCRGFKWKVARGCNEGQAGI
jgi:hypothetical protein